MEGVFSSSIRMFVIRSHRLTVCYVVVCKGTLQLLNVGLFDLLAADKWS